MVEEDAPCQVAGDVDSPQGKTNILLQAFVSQAHIKDSALISDSNYVAQNSARICRSLFLIAMNRRWGKLMNIMLSLCKSIDKRIWAFEHPMTQFELPQPVLRNIKAKIHLCLLLEIWRRVNWVIWYIISKWAAYCTNL